MRYNARFYVTVELVVDDSDVLTRCSDKSWKRAYRFVEAMEEPVETLARCCGIFGLPLSHLDGWGDCSDDAVHARITNVELEDIRI